MKKLTSILIMALLVCGVASAGVLSTTWTLRNVVDPPDCRDGLIADSTAADTRLDDLEAADIVAATNKVDADRLTAGTTASAINGENITNLTGTASADGTTLNALDLQSCTNLPGTAIQAATLVNAAVAANAAIALTKLGEVTSARIIVGNAGGQAVAVDLSGDATMSNAGALAIADDAVTADEIGAGEFSDDVAFAGLVGGYVLKTSAYVPDTTDFTMSHTPGGKYTNVLPEASTVLGRIWCIRTADGSNNMFVNTDGTDTLDSTGNKQATFADTDDSLIIQAIGDDSYVILFNTGVTMGAIP